jgi:hypothetical protein
MFLSPVGLTNACTWDQAGIVSRIAPSVASEAGTAAAVESARILLKNTALRRSAVTFL